MKNIIFILFVAFSISSFSFSQIEYDGDWIFCTSKVNELDVYILNKPIKEDVRDDNSWYSKNHPNSDKVKVKFWIKLEFKKKEKIKNQFASSVMQLMEFDLSTEKDRTVELIYYNAKGDVILHKEDYYYSEWSNIIPNSLGHSMFESIKEIIEQIQIKEIEVSKFISSLKNNRIDELAKNVAFPFERLYPLPRIKNKQEFLNRFEEIFDKQLIELIVNSSFSEWEEMGDKFTFNNGEVCLSIEGKLLAVNHQTTKQFEEIKDIINCEKKSLHESLFAFQKPIISFVTETHRVRIDEINDDNFRFCMWGVSKPWDEIPDLILENGLYQEFEVEGNSMFEFKNGEIKYQCSLSEVGEDGSSNDFFRIIQIDKNILFQKIYILSREEIEIECQKVEEIKKEKIRKKEVEEKERLKQIKFLELSKKADEFAKDKKFRTALKFYNEANVLYSQNEILLIKINEISIEIAKIDSLINLRQIIIEKIEREKSIFEDTVISQYLFDFKKSFAKSYDLCLGFYKNKYDSVFIKINYDKNDVISDLEYWTENNQENLQNLQKLLFDMGEFGKAKKILELAIIEKDKTTLKLLNSSINPRFILKEILNKKIKN